MNIFFRYCLFIFLIHTGNVYAYIDPSTGLLFWQGLVALIGAIIIFYKSIILKIKEWIKWFKNERS